MRGAMVGNGIARQMLKHYSHIRMKAKREALDAVWKKQREGSGGEKPDRTQGEQDGSPECTEANKVEEESLQKSLQSGVSRALLQIASVQE